MGLAPGTLVPVNATNDSLVAAGPSNKGLTASEDLYRGADTLSYGDSKPSEDAIDRVVGKINKEWVVCALIDVILIAVSARPSERRRTIQTRSSRISTRGTRCSTKR